MLLHELELLGFKSFGERTRLRFDPSFTAIVGPNGSGKSNVVDAIRWLLGEQSHKQLRTPDSSEVLYQGEQAEDRMNFAQVEMTLIPSPGETFGEGNGESLAIGRRYERDGSNHYLINGHKARLKDVRQTLAEYGFGLNAMSILSQGRIDAVLSLMPEERRVILEEVAQVHGFQVNKEKTLDKIAATRDNLQRLEDVLKEVTERMAELAQQALAARRHQELLEAKADRERWLTARDLDRRHAAADTLRGELRDAEAAVESYREQVAQVREELAEVEALAQGLATELTAHLAQQSELAVQAAEARSANQRISDQEARLREAAGTAARRQESLSARAKDLAAAMAQLEFDLAEARRHAEEATKRYQETQAERQSLVGELARVESAFEASRQSREDLLARQRRVERELAGVEERLSQLAHGQSELKGQQERLATQAAELEEEVRTRGAATEEAAREAERRNGSLLSLTEEVAEVRADVLQFQEAWQEAAHLRAAREAELRTLEELEQNLEGYQAGVRALLQETELGASGALALLMEQVQIDPRYAVAVEAALGNLTQLVVAEDWDAARAALRELADRHLGRAALAVLEAVPAVEPQRLIQTTPTLEPDESRQDISARGDHWGDRGEWGQVHGPRETKIHAPLHPALRTGPLPLTAAMEAPASLQPLLEAL
ncbi:MAG TPA: AAA family ATPase, partial [bacterium]|nr:AAA family ATPase [bacterium]